MALTADPPLLTSPSHFETFTKRWARISADGRITISGQALAVLGADSMVLLGFDHEACAIGLQATTSARFGYTLQRRPGQSRFIRPLAFLRYHGIDHAVSRRYDNLRVDDGWLVIPLAPEG
jgi:hypothetical protein